MTIFGNINAVRVSTGFLNTVDDPTPGAILASPSGSIVQPYGGQVGQVIALSAAEALRLSYTTTGTLYGGVYMYVKFKAGSTASNARGQLVFWDDLDNFVVTPDAAAANISKMAGVTLNAVTKGQYGWIQIAGKASVLAAADVTKVGDIADGDLCIVTQTPANTVDTLADATGLTSVTAKCIVGVALEAIAAAAVGKVLLRFAKPIY